MSTGLGVIVEHCRAVVGYSTDATVPLTLGTLTIHTCISSGSTTFTVIGYSLGRDVLTELSIRARGAKHTNAIFRSVTVPETWVFKKNIGDRHL